ncbi:regulatory protein RecX (plasmid) [Legionella adelaidensis]|uniref:Regulatory protein RecX n=1 Tax=Legionella adelaidensis TaxID=45056 RepID=A0A0W0R3G2_9GAMM|nr:recombination regulator RecX [Legionella adelaidensis]KTC65608.1 recombination regulator RecX [Legionella adelaidensis]VEH85195.1 regulatory protein RecX [Legionella adelaidensis]
MNKAYAAALRLLTRREHGAFELHNKLKLKGFAPEEIAKALKECQSLGLQDDRRFAESFCRMRVRQGYGPVRVEQELKNLRIVPEIVEEVIEGDQESWVHYAFAVWEKKYKSPADNFAEMQKQKRFLLYRGFTPDVIAEVEAGWRRNPKMKHEEG